MRLVQLQHGSKGRFIAIVEEPNLRLVNAITSVYDLAMKALEDKEKIKDLLDNNRTSTLISYEEVYKGSSDYSLLPPFDCPGEPLKLMLAGTGLTHKASAENRDKMHLAQEDKQLTDSMKIYLMGVEGGWPEKGKIGVQPEWFYKGNGSILKAHNEVLEVPVYAEDGGEEPEVAAAYIVDKTGKPFRLGFMIANEFSDHRMERKNYLYLAPSKIRNCSVGPELCLDTEFTDIRGEVSIFRNGEKYWSKEIKTGEKNMSHSLKNLEYHHFKYDNHRIPGMAHLHFFGADAFSFGEGIELKDKDAMQVSWRGLGRALINNISITKDDEQMLILNRLH